MSEANKTESRDPRNGRSRRRRRPRRRPNKGSGRERSIEVQGYLWLGGGGQACLVSAESSFAPANGVPLVPTKLIAPMHLESGLKIEAEAQVSNDRARVVKIKTIEGMPPEEYRRKAVPFIELVSIDPEERYRLETDSKLVEPRVAELIAPLGRGQRCLIVAPPKTGKTTLLQQMARAIAINHPNVNIFVLLVDERPEEVTDWRRSIARGEVFASSSDQSIESHIQISEMVAERARRLVELGEDVVVFMDSLTRMSRAYNNVQKGSGRILSGGIDARTMEKPRRFFGSARNTEGGGSLTIVATCLIDTGSRMDEVIFQEFKGTGNMELVLERRLFDKRIFPCINIAASGTRKEEKLYPKPMVEKLHLMRRALSSLSSEGAMELLLQKVREFPSNAQFLESLRLS